MKRLFSFVTVGFFLLSTSCTTISGSVDLSPEKLVTDHGLLNIPKNFLGTLIQVVPAENGKLYASRIDSMTIPENQQRRSSSTKDTASLKGSFGASANVTVNPPDSSLQAEAKAAVESGITFTLVNAHRLEIISPEDFVTQNFSKLKQIITKYHKSRIWLATFTTEGESIAIDSLQTIGSSLKASHPQIGSFNVDVTSTTTAAFSRVTSDISLRAPLFISYQELIYDDQKDQILLQPIPPQDLANIGPVEAK